MREYIRNPVISTDKEIRLGFSRNESWTSCPTRGLIELTYIAFCYDKCWI